MSRNGTGTYSLPAGNPVITGTVIASTWANSTLTDIASALTASVAADGQTPMTGDLDLNSNKIVNLQDPVNAQDAATKAYVNANIPNTSTFLIKASNLSDLANASTSRTNLGLGSIATQNANAVAITGGTITGGTITGITDLAVADGGTGSSTLSANAVLLGNGTSALQTVAPSTTGNVLTSNGTTWTSTASSAIGVSQTWQNVIGSRAYGVTYTNSTGKAIMVNVYYTTIGTYNNMTAVVGGVDVASMLFNLGFGNLGTGDTFSFIVPNGVSYILNAPYAPTIQIWAELR